jgi:hypothetical protein
VASFTSLLLRRCIWFRYAKIRAPL